MKPAFLFLLVSLMTGTGCQTLAYYSQAAKGQAQVLFGQKRISDIVKDPEVPQKLKNQLTLVLELREFARNKLKMNPEGNYLKYRNLKRKYVLWVVYAAPPLSVKLKTWWYPIAGKFTSRGFFTEEDARKFADRLQEEGMDVYIGGAPAYSTLGWFNDPVLNTFIRYQENSLAELIFHELAHHHLFIKDDATFNESFATAVAQIGVARWLETKRGNEQRDEYVARYARRYTLSELLAKNRSQLKKLYASKKTLPEKREGKKELIGALKKDLVALSKSDPGYRKLAVWAKRPINNAVLGARSVYHRRVPAFYALYEQNDRDMEAFLNEVEKIAHLQKKERDSLLAEYEKNAALKLISINN
jgi:predicted aminopeptidase